MKAGSFEELFAFQKARELSRKVYEVTKVEPWRSDYRFAQQIHASAGSIMDNIAEGYERSGNKELLNFLFIAKGSCGEVRSQVIRAYDCEYISKEKYEELYADCRRLSAAIMNFIKEVRESEFKGAKYLNP